MQVLLTNDDGIYAPGLWALYQAFAEQHRVCVVAPDRERSAVGHGITLHQPIRSQKTRINGGATGFAVNGTPADCVKLGLAELLETPPELVVSGINPGANVGVNVNYSGTVAAAKEAAMAGIPAMAVSITAPGDRHMKDAAVVAASFCRQMMDWKLPQGTFLNVNFPDLPKERIRGVRWSRQGANGCAQHFEKRLDPRNRTYYWQGCDAQGGYDRPDIDGAALQENYISITPIKCDMTDYDALNELARRKVSISY
ncbi:5'-nucleotidase SurE [Desulfosarcina widdelii]|uniref:5'-nucleotidase SurE n=1 Tax=Desulfosarcina widdelii TaxID=947919 RepID=A0A5K7ZQ31_9BACT|nr:5'/3'-nucleotidase SurE [Desulfosarcina widdelii]BBO78927.1 5'-nucleotidase SurE [Desulfosarcina widdelii]